MDSDTRPTYSMRRRHGIAADKGDNGRIDGARHRRERNLLLSCFSGSEWEARASRAGQTSAFRTGGPRVPMTLPARLATDLARPIVARARHSPMKEKHRSPKESSPATR